MLQRLLFGFGRPNGPREDHAEERRRSGYLAEALLTDRNLVHELLASMVLSEAVYKKDDKEVVEFIQLANGLLPWREPGNKITELQFSSDWASQRCVVTESGGGLFVCFRGTKVQRDFLTDLNVFFDPVFDVEGEEGFEPPKKVSKWETPCAHRGFLFRAKAVPVIWFYKIAKEKGLRLVFTGHSLGGAVATLATLRLLHWIEKENGKQIPRPNVACISFAAPAIGNLALQKYVAANRWDTSIYNYTLKEDFVPILMQPQRLLRWKGRNKSPQPASANAAASPAVSGETGGASDEHQTPLTKVNDIEGGALASASSSSSSSTSGLSQKNVVVESPEREVEPMQLGEGEGNKPSCDNSSSTGKEGETAAETETASEGKNGSKSSGGSGRYYQMVKFAVRLRRMVPITISRGKTNGDAKLANTFAYIGRQLTVLEDKVIPASLKHEVLKEYEKLSEDVGEGVARDSVSSTRWNLMRWATQSFESHRMYTYRDKILAACGLPEKAENNNNSSSGPDSLQVLLTSNVLPRIELNFGTVRLCKPLDSTKRRNSASVHITLAGKHLTSCKAFHMGLAEKREKGRLWKVDKFFSSKLDRDRASLWTRMRFPMERLSFWDKAFQNSEEIYQLLLQVQLGSALQWEDLILKPIEAICKSDFQEESSSLVLVPIHVRLSGRQLGYTRTIYELLQHYAEISLRAEEFGDEDDPPSSSFVVDNNNIHRQQQQQQKVIDYSVLNSFDVIRSMMMISRPAVTVEETSDMIVFVDTLDNWRSSSSAPSIPYQLRKAFKLGIESLVVLLNNTGGAEEPPQETTMEVEARVRRAGFTNVMLMSAQSSQRVLLGTSFALSPMTLYHALSRQGYRNSLRSLAQDEELEDQVEAIRAMIHASASINQNPSPLMLQSISIQ